MKREWILFNAIAAGEQESWFGVTQIVPETVTKARLALVRMQRDGLPVVELHLHAAIWWFDEETALDIMPGAEPDDGSDFRRLTEDEGQRFATSGRDKRAECDELTIFAHDQGKELYFTCFPDPPGPDGFDDVVRSSPIECCNHERQDVNDRSQCVCLDCGEELGR